MNIKVDGFINSLKKEKTIEKFRQVLDEAFKDTPTLKDIFFAFEVRY